MLILFDLSTGLIRQLFWFFCQPNLSRIWIKNWSYKSVWSKKKDFYESKENVVPIFGHINTIFLQGRNIFLFAGDCRDSVGDVMDLCSPWWTWMKFQTLSKKRNQLLLLVRFKHWLHCQINLPHSLKWIKNVFLCGTKFDD